MAQLVGLIVSEDESFRKPLGRLLRTRLLRLHLCRLRLPPLLSRR